MSPSPSTPPLPPEEIRAAAEVHRELGPEFQDAVVDSFIARVNNEMSVRAAARADEVKRSELTAVDRRRQMLKGIGVGAALTGIPLTVFAINLAQQPNPGGYPAKLILVWVLIVALNLAWAGWHWRPRGG